MTNHKLSLKDELLYNLKGTGNVGLNHVKTLIALRLSTKIGSTFYWIPFDWDDKQNVIVSKNERGRIIWAMNVIVSLSYGWACVYAKLQYNEPFFKKPQDILLLLALIALGVVEIFLGVFREDISQMHQDCRRFQVVFRKIVKDFILLLSH